MVNTDYAEGDNDSTTDASDGPGPGRGVHAAASDDRVSIHRRHR